MQTVTIQKNNRLIVERKQWQLDNQFNSITITQKTIIAIRMKSNTINMNSAIGNRGCISNDQKFELERRRQKKTTYAYYELFYLSSQENISVALKNRFTLA